MTTITFTLKGKRFTMTTDEVRAEAARLLHKADVADLAAKQQVTASVVNALKGPILESGVVTYRSMMTALEAMPGQRSDLRHKSSNAWHWLKNYLVHGRKVTAICVNCGQDWNNIWCGCATWHTPGPNDPIGIWVSDLIKFKDDILGQDRKMTKPERGGLALLFQVLDDNRESSS